MYDKSMKVSELSHINQLTVKTENQNASPAWQSERSPGGVSAFINL